MGKLNIAELLKDCPRGMELYSPLCGKCVFDHIHFGTIICKTQNNQDITFTRNGYYMLPVSDDCECVIFPSKDQRDWSKFQRPFKDGDIIYVKDKYKQEWCSIIKNCKDGKLHDYVDICINSNSLYYDKPNILCCYKDIIEYRLATEEEKEKLFRAIKERGYKWNAETKTLEKLIKPKFKMGDRIKHKKSGVYCNIGEYVESFKGYNTSIGLVIRYDAINDWELYPLPSKFDITTLKPFDKVLVRDKNVDKWKIDFWGFYDIEYAMNYPYGCCGNSYAQCIPYEGNEQLLGTTNDCSEYFKTWKI